MSKLCKFIYLSSLCLAFTTPAHAEWQDVADLGVSEKIDIDVDKCDYRLKFKGQYEYRRFMMTRPSVTIPTYGRADSIRMVADLTMDDLNFLARNGAFSSANNNWQERIEERALVAGPFQELELTLSFARTYPSSKGRSLTLSHRTPLADDKNVGTGYLGFRHNKFILQQSCSGQSAATLQDVAITHASSDSNYSNNYTAANAVDGNTNSYWIGERNNDLHEVTFYTEQESRLKQVTINWFHMAYRGQIKEVYIGDNEQRAEFRKLSSSSNGLIDTYELLGSTTDESADSLRIVFSNGSSGYAVIRELTVKGLQ